MFTIDSEATVKPYPLGSVADPEDSRVYINTKTELAALVLAKPSEWGVKLWNALPGAPLILTGKFRNRATAVDRIWQKLCQLYPDAVSSEDMPKAKTRLAKALKGSKPVSPAKVAARKNSQFKAPKASSNGTRKSAWAEELTEALKKQFKAGDSFELQDVYKLIPQFQRKHKENHHIAARLRTTLAQDLRGRGIVKTAGKGKYKLVA